jgi:hypothetical protein
LVRAAIARENRRGWPANIYLHPREIDPQQPRLKLPVERRFKYYVGLTTTERKVQALLRDHRFVTASDWIENHAPPLAGRALDVRAQAASAPPQPPRAHIPPPPGDGDVP